VGRSTTIKPAASPPWPTTAGRSVLGQPLLNRSSDVALHYGRRASITNRPHRPNLPFTGRISDPISLPLTAGAAGFLNFSQSGDRQPYRAIPTAWRRFPPTRSCRRARTRRHPRDAPDAHSARIVQSFLLRVMILMPTGSPHQSIAVVLDLVNPVAGRWLVGGRKRCQGGLRFSRSGALPRPPHWRSYFSLIVRLISVPQLSQT
jgi:hypothetical protein